MRKLIPHLAVLLLLIAAVSVGVTASRASTPTRMGTVAKSLPDSCQTTRISNSGADLWTRMMICGACVVVVYDTAALRDRALTAIASAVPPNSWLAVGNNWIATHGSSTAAGDAFACADRLGGFATRLTG